MLDDFLERFCPHRGFGRENTPGGIEEALLTDPYFVEFDVRLHNGELYLGHPPLLNTGATLQQVLALFDDRKVMPKIDLKLEPSTQHDALSELIHQLRLWGSHTNLVNISGQVTPSEYMRAESWLLENTNDDTLLNIDLGRYDGKTDTEIERHLAHLKRKPFSISPNLDDDVGYAIGFARRHNIGHLHLWSHSDKEYDLDYYFGIMQQVREGGLQVYFDIKHENVVGLGVWLPQ